MLIIAMWHEGAIDYGTLGENGAFLLWDSVISKISHLKLVGKGN